MENKEILISVVIPVKNGDVWLDNCIQSIISQTLFHCTEIIVIDSGSTDKSLQILEKYPVKVISIPAQKFNHGLTRNFALSFCQGKYVAMTVQDARAADPYWLQHLLDGFSKADHVAGVCGQQIVPHEKGANPAGWFRPVTAPTCHLYRFDSAEAFLSLSSLERKNCCGWDNVTAMYLKKALLEVPFQNITYGEDSVWARDALVAGYAIVYNYAARVFHYHNEDWHYTFKRSLTTLYLRYKTFDYVHPMPKLTLRDIGRTIKLIWIAEPLSYKEKLNWFICSLQHFDALKKAHVAFYRALAEGDETLDKLHQQHCGKPPVALKGHQYAKSPG